MVDMMEKASRAHYFALCGGLFCCNFLHLVLKSPFFCRFMKYARNTRKKGRTPYIDPYATVPCKQLYGIQVYCIVNTNVIKHPVLNIRPWPNDQTLFVKHLKCASKVFEQLATAQKIYYKQKRSLLRDLREKQSFLKSSNHFLLDASKECLTGNVSGRGRTVKHFA